MSYVGNTPTQQAFTPAIDYFSGNGSTVAFTLSRPVASVAQVQVVVNNVPQNPSTAFTVLNNTITFTGAPSLGTNNIYVEYTSPITQVIQPGQGTVGITALSATGTASSSTFLRGDNTWASAGFPTGTAMLFVQTAAPTGWTKLTSHDNKALRVVSGTASTGGSVAFTTAFASQGVSGSVGSTTLSTAQMPSHTHTYSFGGSEAYNLPQVSSANGYYTNTTSAAGGGGSHNHSFSGTAINLAVSYVDVIIATKD